MKLFKSIDWGFMGFLFTLISVIALFGFYLYAVTQPLVAMVAK
jgi:hypothetical protein